MSYHIAPDSPELPVELVVATELHRIAGALAKVTIPAVRRQADGEAFLGAAARGLLCEIAHNADLGAVLAALAAVGAPASTAEIKARLAAVTDSRRPAPAAKPPEAAP